MDAFTKSKLAEVLFTLSKRQRKDLIFFIKIPSLHLKNYEIGMCQYIINQIEKGKSQSLSKTTILQSNKRDKKQLEKNWNYATSNLLKTTYRFLSFQLSDPDQMPYGYTHLNFFREKELVKNYNAHSNKLLKNLQTEASINNQYYYHEFLLWELKLDDTRYQRKNLIEFKHYQNALDKFYAENLLRIACEVVSRGKIFQIKNFNPQHWIAKKDFLDVNTIGIKVFFYIYKMFTTSQKSLRYYVKARNLLRKSNKYFSTYDLRTIYEYLLNYCIINLNAGNKDCALEYLSHIKTLEVQNLLLDGQSITPQKYKNTITAGLIAGEIEWIEQFVYRYKDHIKIKQKDNILHYNLGNLEFHKGNFEKALEHLVLFQPFDFYYKIGYEKLILKIFYERKDVFAIKKRVSSFVYFINSKDDLPVKYKVLLLNFIKYLKAMLKGKKIDTDMLLGKVPFTDYLWFKKKQEATKYLPSLETAKTKV